MDDRIKAVDAYRTRRDKRMKRTSNMDSLSDVDLYKIRRYQRLAKRARMDAEDPAGWITVNGNHIPVNEAGEAIGGQPRALGESGGSGKSSGKVSESKSGRSSGKKGSPSKSSVGNVKTGKHGNLAPKSDKARMINVSDAMEENAKWAEQGLSTRNSLADYIDENGNLTPERQAVHDKIISDFFKDKVPCEGQATLIMAGGGPASGKSFVSKGANEAYGGDSTIKIDPDEFKAMLPGYEELAAKDKTAASIYHEESSALAKRAYQFAADNNLNVVYDGTGDNSPNSVLSKLKTAQDAGYAIKGEYVTVDVDEALRRNQSRYEHMKEKYEKGESKIPPRLPKEEDVRKIHTGVTDTSIRVASQFDDFKLYDNNVPQGKPPVLIATCKKGGQITAVKGMEDKLQKYLDKGTTGAKVVNGVVVID